MASAQPPARPGSFLRIVAWVLPFAVALAALASLYQWSVTCLDCGDPPPPRPSVTFDNPGPIVEGFACRVAYVSMSAFATKYHVVLRVNESGGTAVGLSENMSFTVDGRDYAVAWIDSGAEGQLTAADEFRGTRPGGLLPSTDYTLVLLWPDGSIIRTLTYHAP